MSSSPNNKRNTNDSQLVWGFTLIEIVIVLGVVAGLLVVGFLSLGNLRGKQALDSVLQEITVAARDTQKKSIAQEEGARWNIRFSNDGAGDYRYEVFSGVAYSPSAVQKISRLRNSVRFTDPFASSTRDVFFNPLTGRPLETKIISLANRRSDGLVGDVIIKSLGSILPRLETGVLGYWHFDENTSSTAYDASGMGNNGTLINGPTWATASNCKSGSCLGFDTSFFQQVSISNSLGLGPKTALTLSAWIYPTGTGGSDVMSTVIQGLSPPAYYLSFNDSVNALSCYWYDTIPAGYHTTGNNSISLNQWSHIACVWDGTNIKQYINGMLANTVAVTGAGASPTLVVIGAETTARQFQGIIDEVRIYNRALSAEEVKRQYYDLK